MALTLSKKSKGISQADIRVMTLECDKVKGVNLAQGVCDTGVPDIVREAANRAMLDGFNSYTRYDGLRELREAISGKMLRFNGIKADPENEITVSAGSTGALYCAFLALLDPGDEVIVFEPYYGYHINTILAVDAVPKFITMRTPDWSFSFEDLEKSASPKTKGIIICTPANPCGKVWSEDEIKMVGEFARKHDCFIFTDEIYEYFVYDGLKHMSPASFPEISDRTITISGYSKTYSITGWRIGYSVADKRWADIIGYINDLVYVCAPAPLQLGVAKGINDLRQDFYTGLRDEFLRKRELICNALKLAGLIPHIPAGAYYVLADVSSIPGADSREKAMYILNKTGVASVPGRAFFSGSEGDNLVRFCYAKTDAELNEACERLMGLRR
jgi:aminotransferase